MTDAITREHRTKLLSRRVRAVMRVVYKTPSYLKEKTPNISWDETFIPTELYTNLAAELASFDAKESQQVQKEKKKERENEKGRENEEAKESQRRMIEEQRAKEKAKVTNNDKGKANEIPRDLGGAERPRGSWMRKNSVFGTDSGDEDSIIADVGEPSEAMQNESKDILGITDHGGAERPRRSWMRKNSVFGTDGGDEDSVVADVGEPSGAMQNESKDILGITSDFSGDDTSVDGAEPPGATQINKRKAKDAAQDSENFGGTLAEKNQKRKCISDDTSADEAEPPAKRDNRKKSIDEAPPCRQCIKSKAECIPNGWPAACKRCRQIKMACSLAKARNRHSSSQTTKRPSKKSIEDDEEFVDQLNPQISNIGTTTTKKGQLPINSMLPPAEASNSKGKGSSSFSYCNSFDLEHIKLQLEVSQDELRIVRQELQLANTRIEAQRRLYEAELAGYRRGQGSSGKNKERV
jgi:hypothetical protein